LCWAILIFYFIKLKPFIMSSIKIPLSLRGKFIHVGAYAVFTDNKNTATRVADKIKKADLVRRTGCGKMKVGASAVFWAFYSCLNDPALYA